MPLEAFDPSNKYEEQVSKGQLKRSPTGMYVHIYIYMCVCFLFIVCVPIVRSKSQVFPNMIQYVQSCLHSERSRPDIMLWIFRYAAWPTKGIIPGEINGTPES